MTAARVVGLPDGGPEVILSAVQRELSQLHILLLGVRADVDDVLSPARPPSSGADLKQGVKRAITCLNALRDRLQEG